MWKRWRQKAGPIWASSMKERAEKERLVAVRDRVRASRVTALDEGVPFAVGVPVGVSENEKRGRRGRERRRREERKGEEREEERKREEERGRERGGKDYREEEREEKKVESRKKREKRREEVSFLVLIYLFRGSLLCKLLREFL